MRLITVPSLKKRKDKKKSDTLTTSHSHKINAYIVSLQDVGLMNGYLTNYLSKQEGKMLHQFKV